MIFANIVNLIIWLVIIGLVWWLVSLIPLPPPFPLILQVAFIILAILVILDLFGLFKIGVPRLYK